MSEGEAVHWHEEAISAATAETLAALSQAKLMEQFYLAGGTGLALALGHRLSLDLDFFAPELFAEEILLQRLQELPDFLLVAKGEHTLHATVGTTKVSWLGYPYPLLFPARRFRSVSVADPRDIACMKISAIAGGGAKRDFLDLFVCTRQFGLGALLELFDQKYRQTHYNRLHVLKSLTFFDDADKDPMPHMLRPLAWDEIRGYFEEQVRGLT